MDENILTLKNLSVSYGTKKILHDVNFSVKRGEIFVIVGESGSGKSTILKSIAGLLPKSANIGGQIFFGGREILKLPQVERRKLAGASIAMIFQNAGASFCPIRTIGAQIFECVQAHQNWTREEFLTRAKKFMRNIHLDESVLNEYPFRLSGGMAQRAGILAAMILEPKLILADEPTSALDAVTQDSVINELLKLREVHGISIVMVTHNLNVAKNSADKILIMRRGVVVEFGTKEKIFSAPQELYTQELLASSQ